MGTSSVRYSLVSREVIADAIETCVGKQWMDGVLVLGGRDESLPDGMMGMLRPNTPRCLDRLKMVGSNYDWSKDWGTPPGVGERSGLQ